MIVRPLADFGGRLLDVEKPARYLGGEALASRKEGEGLYTVALCFPDLYEIGMSNNAIRILYSGLNALPSVRAERVFAPAPDFEALLKERSIPLYTLESGIALSGVDMLGISLGYELTATNIVTILETGRIPVRAAERGEGDPLVISGGPAITNPHPYALFLDAAYIGEAEAGFYELAEELAGMKASGAKRSDMLDRLSRVDAVWMPERAGRPGKRATRAVFGGFGESPASTALPLPAVKTVQDHGTVEIMRGCPNGCRFCHAGYYYRPQRIKDYEVIRSEVEALVHGGGYREITLSSLSSGDFPGIGELLDALNAEWGPQRVSFQLPSLKINSFTLPVIRKLAEVRKSGLTFAVETPVDEWQRRINKDVSFERTVAILEEARSAGFKQAKFYFMIGLPVLSRAPGSGNPALAEAKAIVEFFQRLLSRIRIQINVNVGTFVPKPHTPFQWAAQLSEEEALEAVNYLRAELRPFKNLKLSYHSPFNSLLEGVIARGDERVGELILAAHAKGARLDAWEEHFNRDLWREVLASASWPVLEESCRERGIDEVLPWDDVGIRVSKAALKREYDKSQAQEFTSACMENCTEPCGSCSDEARVVNKTVQAEAKMAPSSEAKAPAEALAPAPARKPIGRMVFKYCKEGPAAYMQHLSIIDAFERAFLMASLDIAYSEGFNPMPRLETAQPISIAIKSVCEIASILLLSKIESEAFVAAISSLLPKGLRILDAAYYSLQDGKKQRTIGSLEWGSVYAIKTGSSEGDRHLYEKLESILKERSVEDAQLSRSEDGAIRLRLKLPDNKEKGLLRILEACTERRPVQAAFAVKREELLASKGEGQVQGFFEAYKELE
jgi:radical SAM family uncharacterized protein/radical SAM-linked protein